MTTDDEKVNFADVELTPWPRKDHDLRARPGANGIYAHLSWQQGRGSLGRIMGYRRAAEILANAMLQNSGNVSDLDTVIFPFAACWRHYVELQLKSLMKDLTALLDQPAQRRGGHNIEQFWHELRPMLERLIRPKSAATAAPSNAC